MTGRLTPQGIINQHERAAKVQSILDERYEEGAHEQNVGDILADLMHFCELRELDYWTIEKTALGHYQNERREEG